MKKNRSVIIFSILIFFAFANSGCRVSDPPDSKTRISDEQMVNINRELVIKERERIESYIERKELDMNMSDAGIWYLISNNGSGDNLRSGDRVRLQYTCSLLDGTLCYSSDINGDLNVTIGRSDIPSGLDEALRILKTGSEAIIILPSNMAFGLVGDGDRIPARAALIYELKVLAE